MARRRKEHLTDKAVTAVLEGLTCDGSGLYLRVTRGADGSLNRSWLYRFAAGGRERWMGLGAYPDVSLRTMANDGKLQSGRILTESGALANDREGKRSGRWRSEMDSNQRYL